MPGAVQIANPLTVMPESLCSMFVHSRNYPLVINEYRDGRSQRSVWASTSRKEWRLQKILSAEETSLLKAFYEARKGPLESFYFYDPWDTSPQFSYDPSGATYTGRYTVRFTGTWPQFTEFGFSTIEIGLIEIY